MSRRDGIHVIVPLLLGALVYVAWRTTDVQLVTWLPSSVVVMLRGTVGRLPLPSFVLGSAPDLAWGYAFGAAMGIVWRGRPASRRKIGWLALGALVASYAEVGQLWQLPPGRFDVVDLLAIVLGYAIGAWLTSRAKSPRSTPSLPSPPSPLDRDQEASPNTPG